ncbi:MAG: sulfatase-like protein [Paracoccaceae bacterium]
MKKVLVLALATAFIFAVLVLPNHPGTMRWSALNRFPLELPVLVFGLLAIGRHWGVPAVLAIIFVTTVIIKLADYGMFIAYNRTFNPILDTFLIKAGIGLLSDSIGKPAAYVGVLSACIAILLLFFGLLQSFRVWARTSVPTVARTGAAIVAVFFASIAVADAGHHLKYWKFNNSPPGTSWTSRLTFKRMVEMQDTTADLIAFSAQAKTDPYRHATGLFDKIGNRDVILIYIESYGRTSFENPLYMDTHLGTLTQVEGPIRDAGFAIRSGWMTSPTEGGQSWLAHGAVATGLWTSDHGRYNAMIASGHKWLFHFAAEAGYRTAAVMPAITVGWPESSAMGFELIYPAADIPYAGERFNWVTVPDQFTLSVYNELLGEDPRNDFIQIALISSHAPWVPVPEMLPWDAMGDGTVFNQWATQGPSPREVWKDYDKVREQYRLAVDYSLQATFEHVAHLGDDAPLIIVVGDHQPAGFVSQIDSLDVPVHMIGPPAVIKNIDAWNWTDGLIPAADAPVWRMDAFRDQFIKAFTSADIVAEVREDG